MRRPTPPELIRNDGRAMPRLGLGAYQIPDPQVAAVVRAGHDAGFRVVDTAALYPNECGGAGRIGPDPLTY